MIWLKKNFPQLVSAYVLSTGIFFLANVLFDTSMVSNELASEIMISSLGILFTGSGILYLYLGRKGHLKKSGPSITEVRKEAVSKMKSESLLSDIVHNDPNSSVRRTAARRLKKIDSSH